MNPSPLLDFYPDRGTQQKTTIRIKILDEAIVRQGAFAVGGTHAQPPPRVILALQGPGASAAGCPTIRHIGYRPIEVEEGEFWSGSHQLQFHQEGAVRKGAQGTQKKKRRSIRIKAVDEASSCHLPTHLPFSYVYVSLT